MCLGAGASPRPLCTSECNVILQNVLQYDILVNKEQNNHKMLACCAASISWMELPRPLLSNMLDEPPCDWCGDGAGGGPGAPG